MFALSWLFLLTMTMSRISALPMKIGGASGNRSSRPAISDSLGGEAVFPLEGDNVLDFLLTDAAITKADSSTISSGSNSTANIANLFVEVRGAGVTETGATDSRRWTKVRERDTKNSPSLIPAIATRCCATSRRDSMYSRLNTSLLLIK